MFKKVGLWAGIAVASVLALMPAVALANTETVSAKGVTATFSYKLTTSGATTNLKLTISHHGKVMYSHAVSDPRCRPPGCRPGTPFSFSVHVLDLAHTGHENVLLDLNTGGAHCCSIAQIFTYSPARKTYIKFSYDFFDPGYSVVDLRHNGRYEFRTADDRFVYRFGSYADSGFPVQVLVYAHGRMHNVTRSFPGLIAKDATGWLAIYKSALSQKTNPNGAIAAWAADQELLGHSKLVNQTLTRELKAGHLQSGDSAYPTGKTFVSQLMKLLKKLGYTH